MILTTLGYALVGGILPALIWLYFLLREDTRCPEPRSVIALAFVLGMIAVPLALYPEQLAEQYLQGAGPLLPTVAWAAIEELLKYGMAALFIFRLPAVDESPDYVIYMITVALGFAAAENALFLFSPIVHGQALASINVGDLRFLGSNLLHVVASSVIGFSLAFSLNARAELRAVAAGFGLILAVALHTTFNTFIMSAGGNSSLIGFFLVWTGAIAVFAAFEVLKFFRYRNLPPNTC